MYGLRTWANRLKFAKRDNEHGFTMLEMIFCFAIFCMIVAYIPLLLQIIYSSQTDVQLQRFEWEVFVNQIKKEIRIVDGLYVKNQKVYMQKGRDIVTYEKYQDKLRRRVNDSGHEVLLQNVAFVQFIEITNGVKVNVTDHEGKKYEASMYSYLEFGNGWDVP